VDRRFIIKSNRQKRALEALLSRESISVKDIGPLIGALNPRQIIMELRCQGFEGIIITRRFSVFDQDGKRCLPGEYFIPSQLKTIAAKVLKEHAASQAANRKADREMTNFEFNKEEGNGTSA